MSYDANGSPVEGPTHPMTLPSPPLQRKFDAVGGLLKGFNLLGRDSFPTHLCTITDPREKGVFLSSNDDYHIVVLVDARFRCHGSIVRARPYTALDTDNGETFYGWLDADGNLYDHGERDIHDDHSKVVAWKPYPGEFDLRA